MKLHILDDRDGRILAAAQVKSEASGPTPRPVAREGQTAIELEVPQEHCNLDLHTICRTLRVDTKLKKLVASEARNK
jgi:hypothetical protein